MKLRQNPLTGRLAECIPAEAAHGDGTTPDGPRWFSYQFEEGRGLTVELLTPEQVADWPEVVLTPKPDDPEYAYALACPVCPPHGVILRHHDRERLAATHDESHHTARYTYRLWHPDETPGGPPPHWSPGTEVTFHGSAEGDVAGLVDAVVLDEVDLPDADGDDVHGFTVSVDGRQLFLRSTALVARPVRDATDE